MPIRTWWKKSSHEPVKDHAALLRMWWKRLTAVSFGLRVIKITLVAAATRALLVCVCVCVWL